MATNEELIEVLNEWNFWSKKQQIGKPRTKYLEQIQKGLKTGQIVIISGIRRGGKSTLIKQVISKLIENNIDAKNTLYINFEESRFERSLESLNNLYEAYMELVHQGEKPYIFLDEIQTIPNFESWLRTHYDKETNVKYVGKCP